MAIVYILSFLCLVSIGDGRMNHSSITRDLIRQMLQIVCPGSDVCSDDASNDTTRANSCCTSCSCEPSCLEYGNCCFPDDNHNGLLAANASLTNITTHMTTTLYKDLNTSWPNESNPYVECLYPVARQYFNAFRKIRSQSFWMISAGKNYDKSQKRKEVCGEKNVAPWGSMLPVSSKATGKIYKNPSCAAEHDVKDGIIWNAAIVCAYFVEEGEFFADGSTIILGLESEHFPDYCDVKFSIPHDTPIKRSNICYKDLIDTCQSTDFRIRYDLNISPKAVSEACASGLISPFRYSNMYANVFCHICSRAHFWKDMECSGYYVTKFPEYDAGSLIALLDQSYITDAMSQRRRMRSHQDRACLLDSTYEASEQCKVILCPSLHLPDSTGRCFLPISHWINDRIVIHIKLLSEKSFFVQNNFPTSYNISNLKSPWSHEWIIDKCYTMYDNITNSLETKELLVVLSVKNSLKIGNKRLLSTVRKNMNKVWSLDFQNATLVLKPYFWQFKHIHPMVLWQVIDNFTSLRYKVLYENPKPVFYKRPVFLSKLFFCKQIQLKDSEFKLSKSKYTLFNTVTQQYLGNAEFTPIIFGGKIVTRVCIDDSGYIKTDKQNNSCNTQMSKLLFSCGVTLIILLLSL